jgi:hypothetical protein
MNAEGMAACVSSVVEMDPPAMSRVRSLGLVLAALLAMPTAAATCSLAGLAGGPPPIYEAEDAGLAGKFTIGTDPDASAGEYVYVPAGAGCTGQSGTGEVIFNVTVETAGSYMIWARLKAPDSNHESFFVSVDMGHQALFRATVLGDWVEDLVYDSSAEVKTPIVYALNAGAHQVLFICRSDGTLLDRIRLQATGP